MPPHKKSAAAGQPAVVLRGAPGWSAYHERQFGTTRWNSILSALASEGRFAAFIASAECSEGPSRCRKNPSAAAPLLPQGKESDEDTRCTYTSTDGDKREDDAEVENDTLEGASSCLLRDFSDPRARGTESGKLSRYFHQQPQVFSDRVRDELVAFLRLHPSGLPSPNVFLVAPKSGADNGVREMASQRLAPPAQSEPSHADTKKDELLSPDGSAFSHTQSCHDSSSSPASSQCASLSPDRPSSSPPSSFLGSSTAASSPAPSPCAAASATSAASPSPDEAEQLTRSDQEIAWLKRLEKERAYYLDGASAFAACSLLVSPGDRVLDLCAAPGGKSLVLASMLFPQSVASPPAPRPAHTSRKAKDAGLLVCNEASRPRMERLQKVLKTFLPQEVTKKRLVHVTCASGTKGGSYERFAPFDKILVDAPCSSDRHLLRQGRSALATWATGVPKAHAERQLQLLKSALNLLRVGGVLIYSTCALSDAENEKVVEKLLKLCGGSVKECELTSDPHSPSGSSAAARGFAGVVTSASPEGAAPAIAVTAQLPPGRERTAAVSPSASLENREPTSLWFVERRERGSIILPDTPAGFGPLFMCKLQLVAPLKKQL
ncbi:NOL1/NOP2/sun family protein [Besnoitia besnoiti]|uniref:NOL1/NOP2/Sun domain family member 4 n=1 Tax=Besnoitia besnoiti TaxID=94643 RepID=A0A2A9MDT9_BESBE|nr:NOL1/NOP2/sun family protein [Besnoitia besnoiti]PFH35354.1 NOL1/NOP2/sun family protein [Besnoitia besnoiti]